jgi:predicted ATPase
VSLYDAAGVQHELGQVKIGYVGQPPGRTDDKLPLSFETLDANYFSLGQGVEFYSSVAQLPTELRVELLSALRDVVHDEAALLAAKDQSVFDNSLLRVTNVTSITSQFKRVLNGGAVLTEFHFKYKTEQSDDRAGFELSFDVVPDKKPSQNVHVLIGRNGIGKTTLLNGMVASLIDQSNGLEQVGKFSDSAVFAAPISKGYFAGVVSVSFSAFDRFVPPPDSVNNEIQPKYSYIGLKILSENDGVTNTVHKDLPHLSKEFADSLIACLGVTTKRDKWLRAIGFLESDENFSEMNLSRFCEPGEQDALWDRAKRVFLEKMSSGHAIVLLSITKLIERAEEKTLVILDEPESHLHPPLLSAFIRAISDLLNGINGVAIIATHSPVVLQEVPMSCVWKLHRSRLSSGSERPEMETFGENVGALTRDVFNLEVTKSGFYALLSKSVGDGMTYDKILTEYNNQLGFEGRAILRALVSNRDKLTGEQ